MSSCRGLGGWKNEQNCLVPIGFYFGVMVMKMFWSYVGVVVVQYCE
jgi:hypothetical protein